MGNFSRPWVTHSQLDKIVQKAAHRIILRNWLVETPTISLLIDSQCTLSLSPTTKIVYFYYLYPLLKNRTHTHTLSLSLSITLWLTYWLTLTLSVCVCVQLVYLLHVCLMIICGKVTCIGLLLLSNIKIYVKQ